MKKIILLSSILLLVGCTSVTRTEAINNINEVLRTEKMSEPTKKALIDAKKVIQKNKENETLSFIGEIAIISGFAAILILCLFFIKRITT